MRRLAACSCLAVLWLFAFASPILGADPEQSVLVRVAPLEKHRIVSTLTAFGHVEADPDSERSITVTHEGVVSRVWVRLGERVKAGARLLNIETAPVARMQYRQAKATVEFARSEVARLEGMLQDRLATTEQVAAARQALRQSEAALEAQQKLGTDVAHDTVRAPFDGIVTKLLVKRGDEVAANTTVALIARGDALLIPFGVEPEDASRIAEGMPVTIKPLFKTDIVINGTVDRVHAMVNPSTRLVDALVRVSGGDATRLVLGMIVRGEITLAETRSFAIPRDAVLHDSRGDYIFVISGGRARRVTVRPGAEQDGLVAIEGSLQEGDSVVVVGNYELRDGMRVRTMP